MEHKRLMDLRKNIAKHRPSFRRVESWRYKRVKDPWRKARGIDSRTRIKSKSGVKSPSVGYRGPKKVRGLHPSGYEEVRVVNIEDLKNLNNRVHALKISSKLGSKKRMLLIDYAQNRGFKVLNIGISQKELEDLESMLETSFDDEESLGIDDLEEELKDE
ncbi:MAG: 50S ribosomal protein L32e [Promethearchaeota archaeon]